MERIRGYFAGFGDRNLNLSYNFYRDRENSERYQIDCNWKKGACYFLEAALIVLHAIVWICAYSPSALNGFNQTFATTILGLSYIFSSGTNMYLTYTSSKGFNTKGQLKNHLKIHSNINLDKPKKKYQCNICNGWYSSKGCLGAHMARHNATPVKCDQCDKISPNQLALQIHIRAVHCEAKFKCHLCDKSFKMASSLEGHIATHQDNRNYKCTYCDETFTWRPNMYKHRKNMHHEQWLADQGNEKD